MILGGWEVEREREKQAVAGLCGCMGGGGGGGRRDIYVMHY